MGKPKHKEVEALIFQGSPLALWEGVAVGAAETDSSEVGFSGSFRCSVLPEIQDPFGISTWGLQNEWCLQ